ncbi:helix-hairpin-helix domain-containing protein [Kytococcus schroeteri]|nr:helix-hairpin-helix domain-containing protein [Kytococcus schroeteri]
MDERPDGYGQHASGEDTGGGPGAGGRGDHVVWEGRGVEPSARFGDAARVALTAAADQVDVPSSVAGARMAPGHTALRVMAVLVLVVVLGLGAWTWWTGRQAAPHPVAAPAGAEGGAEATGAGREEGGAPGGGGGAGGGEASGGASAAASGATGDPAPGAAGVSGAGEGAGQVVVHVVGEVRSPGVVRLPSGARVADAVREAGGPTRRADVSVLNLARPVTDGEQLVVLRPGQDPPTPAAVPGGATGPGGAAGAGTTPGGAGGAAPGGAEEPGAGGALDLNTADQAALEELPGVGPVTAEHILAWRTEHGRFTSVDELMEVSGIGEKTLETLRPHVSVR